MCPRALLVLLAAMFATVPGARALDEIVLANGRRYLGTIVAETAQSLVLSIDGGTVEFPRSAVVSPPYLGPPEPPPTAAAGNAPAAALAPPHPLPGVMFALRRMRGFSWENDLRQVPVLVTDRGRWHSLPCVSFWVGGFFQLSFRGDPARPAAIEFAIPKPGPQSWDQKRQLLEYMFDIAPALVVDSRFDRMNLDGDSFAVGDLWFSVTSADSASSPGRWTLLLLHEVSVNPARAGGADLQAISEPISDAMLDPTQPRSWQRGTWTPAELAWLRDTNAAPPAVDAPASSDVERPATGSGLGTDRVFVRHYSRENERYARTTSDWLKDLAAAGP
jgi:hypothetical protein